MRIAAQEQIFATTDDLGLFSDLTYSLWYANLDYMCHRPHSMSDAKIRRIYGRQIDAAYTYIMDKHEERDWVDASLPPDTFGCGLPSEEVGAIPHIAALLNEFSRRRAAVAAAK